MMHWSIKSCRALLEHLQGSYEIIHSNLTTLEGAIVIYRKQKEPAGISGKAISYLQN